MGKKEITVFIIMICLSYSKAIVFGEFIGGVESFDGTVKDLETWEQCVSDSQFSQNESLELVVLPGTLNRGDYTTQDIMIGVGQTVSVEIHYFQPSTGEHTGSYCGLFLTNDSLGTSDNTLWDSEVLGLEYIYSSDSGQFFPCYGGDGSYSGLGFGVDVPPPSYSYPYLFTIERLTSNSAYYSVHQKNNMQLIGLQTLYFSSIDDDLYVSLMATMPTVWDNVKIPEPSSICFISLGVLMLLRKRQLFNYSESF